MIDSKLLETIRAMNPAEIVDFIHSPFYNDRRVRKETLLLFEYITLDHPKCKRDDLAKVLAHQVVFGNKPYSENRLNHVMTALLRLLEAFLAAKFSHTHPETGTLFAMARFYQERDLNNRFEATVAQLHDLLYKVHEEDEENLLQKFQLEDIKHQQSGLFNPRNSDLNLIPVLDNLDNYYITQRLIMSAGLLTRKNLVKVDTSQAMAIYDYMSKWENFAGEIAQKPLTQVYYKLLPLLTDQADFDYVIEFRNYINEIKNDLPARHLKGLYKSIRNYLVVRYNSGESELLPLLFSNLKDEYEQGFLLEPNGMMRAGAFQNMVTIALKLKQFEWARTFMDNNKHLIIGASKPENEFIFNEANYFFHIGAHEMALDTGFHLLKYDNFVYNLAARRLEIKIWHEKQDIEMAEYRLNALKSYLFSNKDNIPDQMKRNNDDFVDIFRQLMSPRNKNNQKRLTALKEKLLLDRKNIAEREWFLDKLGAVLQST